jgi:hypothetical protein
MGCASLSLCLVADLSEVSQETSHSDTSITSRQETDTQETVSSDNSRYTQETVDSDNRYTLVSRSSAVCETASNESYFMPS